MIETKTLPKTISEGVKYYCFGNISEFYSRHRNVLNMSDQTLFRALRGEKVSTVHADAIERTADYLGVTTGSGDKSVVIENLIRKKILRYLDKFFNDLSVESLPELKKAADEYRTYLSA